MFTGGYADATRIAILRIDDGSARPIVDDAYRAAVAADGRSLAYASYDRGVRVVSLDGHGDKQVGTGGGAIKSLEWTADGSALVFWFIDGSGCGGKYQCTHHTVVQRVDGRGSWRMDEY
jgi:Tol biopolymer transport system component